MTDQTILPDPNPIISPDPITAAARIILDANNARLAGLEYNLGVMERIGLASLFALHAFKNSNDPDAAFDLALAAGLQFLIDPLHPDPDYLRADPAEGAKAREARDG